MELVQFDVQDTLDLPRGQQEKRKIRPKHVLST